MAYDAARGRIMLFGGSDGSVYLLDTWQFDGVTWTQVMSRNVPSPRMDAALAYDAARNLAVLFGGRAHPNSPFGDTWEFDGSNWARVATSGPAARFNAGMAYDFVRGRIVLFGGLSSGGTGTLFGDTWEFDGAIWTPSITPNTPPARAVRVMTFDAARSNVVLHGGHGASGPLADTWTYDGSDWTSVAASPITSRLFAAAAYDASRARTVAFDDLAETWEYDGANWIKTVANFDARYGHAVTYDSARARIVLFGGGATPRDDTWEFDGASWQRVTTSPAPSPRTGHAITYDSGRGRTVLFGGGGSSDTWEFDGANWSRVMPATSPPARSEHALVYDSLRRRTVLFGGMARNDTWEFDGANWLPVSTPTAPPPRQVHGLAYDTSRARVVMHGGLDGTYAILDDTWEFDGARWIPIPSLVRPQLASARIVYDAMRQRCIVVGAPWRGALQVWEFDGVSWTVPAMAVPPQERSLFASTYDAARGLYVLVGGVVVGSHGTSLPLADTWELVPAGVPTWARHGSGCPGSAGIPSLDTVGSAVPTRGTTLPLRVTGVPAAPGIVLMAAGFGIARWNGRALPIELAPPDCMLWIEPAPGAAMLVSHGGNTVNQQIPIPSNGALAGMRFAMQALIFDPASSNSLGAVSNAGVATVY